MGTLKKILIFLLILGIISGAAYYLTLKYFLWDIQIDGIPCDFLTVEEALQKINTEKEQEIVTLIFHDGKKYEIPLKEFGVHVDKNRINEIFELQHLNFREKRQYSLDGYILFDDAMIKTYLESIHELQEENMTTPQDAYIVWNEIEFAIFEEQLGDVIDFQEALTLTLQRVKSGERLVNFSDITYITPDILSEHLQSEVDSLNAILNTCINFELTDGSVMTLDSEIIKTWVYIDENDKFAFDTEKGILLFVDELAAKISEVNKNMHFVASDSDKLVTVNVPSNVRAQLDKEAQIEDIKLLLGSPNTLNIRPLYDRELISDMFGNHIELDLSRQHIWFYKDGKLLVDTPCVTGCVRDGNDTPTGVFFLLNKNRDVYLEGYNNDGTPYKSFVKYWMRIYKGIGLHDASWRSKFGGEIYLKNGSHGCINMPEEAARITFENIDNTIPVIVYKSST